MNREAIAEAILAQMRLLTEPPYDLVIPTISREWQLWTDVREQPAVFPVSLLEAPTKIRGLPIKWTLTYDLWVYARKDGTVLGITKLNLVLDALETIFAPRAENAPPNAYVNTLGGLVSSAMIGGPTELDGGYLGDQAIAKMTLEVVTA
jgi:hypothetical protein